MLTSTLLAFGNISVYGNMLVWKDAKIGGEKILANGEASDTDKDYIGHGTPRDVYKRQQLDRSVA